MNESATEYFRQASSADYGRTKRNKKKIKSCISRQQLWKTLYQIGWQALSQPDFDMAAQILNIDVEKLKLIFKYYWYTPGAQGPFTAGEIIYRDMKRKNKIRNQPWIFS